jgi:hypothetical protein
MIAAALQIRLALRHRSRTSSQSPGGAWGRPATGLLVEPHV